MPSLKVIISGGGTGGHIFPAIAIANALQKAYPEIEILFVGALGRMEMEKVPAAGYSIEGLNISGIQRRLTIKNLYFPFKLISSLIKAGKIIKRFKPDVAVGTGGYASGPLLYMASSKGIPCLIQEQNSFPGITNKLLAKKVEKICVAYSGMERFFPVDKIIMTGNPVRQDILKLEGKRERAVEYFDLDPSIQTLLIIGGSLGALTINRSILKGLTKLTDAGIQVIWQTGKSFYHEAQEAAKKYEKNGIRVHEFISKMDYAYAMADVVISRAGASSVSELCLVKKPAVLVPSPNVAEDHQTKNAMALVNHNAAIMVKDDEADEILISTILELLNNPVEMEKLGKSMEALAFRDSADVIASEVLRLVKRKN